MNYSISIKALATSRHKKKTLQKVIILEEGKVQSSEGERGRVRNTCLYQHVLEYFLAEVCSDELDKMVNVRLFVLV